MKLQVLFAMIMMARVFCAPIETRVSVKYKRQIYFDEKQDNVFGAIWEQGEYFEGDMVLTSEQNKTVTELIKGNLGRNGLLNITNRWPNNTVVYYIKMEDFDQEQIRMIEEALQDIVNHSCIQFQPKKEANEHAVLIQRSYAGCFSNVGYAKDVGESGQTLNLASGCFQHGTVVHEMLHTLGFFHMQSTYDRDDYVIIRWENIMPGTESNFAKYNNDTVTDFGVSYDYGSVMHYPDTAFSKNGNKTIEALQANVTLGQRIGMSDKDIIKLNRMYCQESKHNNTNHMF